MKHGSTRALMLILTVCLLTNALCASPSGFSIGQSHPPSVMSGGSPCLVTAMSQRLRPFRETYDPSGFAFNNRYVHGMAGERQMAFWVSLLWMSVYLIAIKFSFPETDTTFAIAPVTILPITLEELVQLPISFPHRQLKRLCVALEVGLEVDRPSKYVKKGGLKGVPGIKEVSSSYKAFSRMRKVRKDWREKYDATVALARQIVSAQKKPEQIVPVLPELITFSELALWPVARPSLQLKRVLVAFSMGLTVQSGYYFSGRNRHSAGAREFRAAYNAFYAVRKELPDWKDRFWAMVNLARDLRANFKDEKKMKAHRSLMIGTLVRMGAPLPMAEEVADQALYAALKHLAKFRGESKFSTWLTRIAINMYVMEYRHEKIVKMEQMPDYFEAVSRDKNVLQELEEKSLRLLLHRLVKGLPPLLRHPVQSIYLDEMLIEEFAALNDISVAATKSRLHRGLVMVRKKYFEVMRRPALASA